MMNVETKNTIDGKKIIFNYDSLSYIDEPTFFNKIELNKQNDFGINFSLNYIDTCNLNCSYCFNKNKGKEKIDIESARKILDKIFEVFDKNEISGFRHTMIGEPFTNKEVLYFTEEYLKQKGYNYTTLVSNAKDLDVKEYKKHKHFISISIDEKIKDRNYNSEEKIKELIKNDIWVDACYTITKDVKEMYEFMKHLKEIGVRQIWENPVRGIEGYWDEEGINNVLNEYKIYFSELEKEVCINRRFDYLTTFIPDGEMKILLFNKTQYSKCVVDKPCFITIDKNGNMSKCEYCLDDKEYYVGNIFDKSFKKEDFYNKYNDKCANKKLEEPCLSCKYKYICSTKEYICKYDNFKLRCEINKLRYETFIRIYGWLKSNYKKDEVEFIVSKYWDRYALIAKNEELKELDKIFFKQSEYEGVIKS